MIATKVCGRVLDSSLSTSLSLILQSGKQRSMSNTMAVRRNICDYNSRSYTCYLTVFDFGGAIGYMLRLFMVDVLI